MSSGFIAVSVSLIGLTGALFTLAIFIQMIVSFPDMLSSNSQAYVHQQRKTYTIRQTQEPRPSELAAEVDAEWGYEQDEDDQDEADSVVERWIDLVHEATNGSSAEASSTKGTHSRRQVGSRRVEAITRGRSLRRRQRAFTKRGIQESGANGLDEQSDYDLDADHKCSPAWQRRMKWTPR